MNKDNAIKTDKEDDNGNLESKKAFFPTNPDVNGGTTSIVVANVIGDESSEPKKKKKGPRREDTMEKGEMFEAIQYNKDDSGIIMDDNANKVARSAGKATKKNHIKNEENELRQSGKTFQLLNGLLQFKLATTAVQKGKNAKGNTNAAIRTTEGNPQEDREKNHNIEDVLSSKENKGRKRNTVNKDEEEKIMSLLQGSQNQSQSSEGSAGDAENGNYAVKENIREKGVGVNTADDLKPKKAKKQKGKGSKVAKDLKEANGSDSGIAAKPKQKYVERIQQQKDEGTDPSRISIFRPSSLYLKENNVVVGNSKDVTKPKTFDEISEQLRKEGEAQKEDDQKNDLNASNISLDF